MNEVFVYLNVEDVSEVNSGKSFFQASPRCANLALKHYLLKPVQRIPQYQLLLTGQTELDRLHVTCRVSFSSDRLSAAQNVTSTPQLIVTDTLLPPAVQQQTQLCGISIFHNEIFEVKPKSDLVT